MPRKMPAPVFIHQSWCCHPRRRGATPRHVPPQQSRRRSQPREWALRAAGIGASFGAVPTRRGAPSVTLWEHPDSPEPQPAPSPRPQPLCCAQKQRETPCAHRYLHQLHPWMCASQPWEKQERNGRVGGPREPISIYTGTSRSFKILKAPTRRGPGFRDQGIPRAIRRERSTSATEIPPQSAKTPRVLPSHLPPQPRYRPDAKSPSDRHHSELCY